MSTLTTQLRPRTLGELLDHAFRLYRRHFFTFIAIIAVVQIPASVIATALVLIPAALQSNAINTNADPGELLFNSGLTLAGSLFSIVITLILVHGIGTAAMTRAITDDYLGQPTSFASAYGRIGGKWGKLVKAVLLGWLITVLLVIWFLIPCIGWLSGMGMLLFFSAIVMPLLPPAVILENQRSAADYVRRAWDLARRRFWWVIGFTLTLILFSLIIVQGPATAFNYVFQFLGFAEWFGDPTTVLIARAVLQSVVTVIASLLYYPLYLTAMTLLYFDLRVRFENFDLNYMAAQVYDETASAETLAAQAPPPSGSLITRGEFGQFILLSLAYGGIIFVIVGILTFIGMALTGLLSGM